MCQVLVTDQGHSGEQGPAISFEERRQQEISQQNQGPREIRTGSHLGLVVRDGLKEWL